MRNEGAERLMGRRRGHQIVERQIVAQHKSPRRRKAQPSSVRHLQPCVQQILLQLIGRQKRSEEHTSELQSLMRISYAVFFLKKKTNTKTSHNNKRHTATTPTVHKN